MNVPSHASFVRHKPEYRDERTLSPSLYETAHDAMQTAYPSLMSKFGHHLAAHPLFAHAAITALAKRHPTTLIETGEGFLNGGDRLVGMDINHSWVRLREIDREAGNDALMRSVLKEIKPIVTEISGAMIQPEARLLVASPHAIVPLHLDEDYAIHLQISGASRVITYSPGHDGIMPQHLHEQAMSRPLLSLPNNQAAHQVSSQLEISPGEALFMPAFEPYRVVVHDEVAVALVLSWRSRWSVEYANACRFNARLRASGAQPDAAKAYPVRNRVKSCAWRALQVWDGLTGGRADRSER